MKKRNYVKKILAMVLAVVMTVSNFSGMGSVAMAATSGDYTRVADQETLDGWKEYFGDTVLSTRDSGSIWTDKSVMEAASAGVTVDSETIAMTDTGKNFLVSLSAIASNKTVTGMAAVPTDTILVLDLSSSMNGNIGALATAANNALKSLAAANAANRVGVVVYAGNVNNNWNLNVQGKAIVLLPLDTYDTSASGGNYLTNEGNTLQLVSGLKNSAGNDVKGSRSTSTGTFTQDGIYTAMEEFQRADLTSTYSGRTPIMVLMSDGAPTMGTTNYTSVGVCNETNTSEASILLAMLNQLTGAYARVKMQEKYKTTPYIYTLGLGIDGKAMAKAVMDPANSDLTNQYWTTLVNNGSVNVGGETLTRAAEITSGSQRIYTDRYFTASQASQLNNVFTQIVDEIMLQTKYLPTLSEAGKENADGYVSFIDRIGKYMEVTDVKGVMIAGELHTGANLAKLIRDGGMGTEQNPSATGDKLVWALQQRLGIASAADVRALIADAYAAGQLSYVSDTNFNNYIGWYADANNNYIGFWDGGEIDTSNGAVYVNKSYLYLGEVDEAHGVQESDMMYTIVQKRHNIATGEETVIFGVPVNLIPVVTYEVSKDEDGELNALEVSGADHPIRMIYEVSLIDGIHEHNVEQMVEEGYAHVNEDGSYYFYTNRWDHDLEPEDTTSNTYAYFRPSKQNERYYYNEDSVVYSDANGTVFQGTLNMDGTYYRGYTVYEKNGNTLTERMVYEQISQQSLKVAEKQEDNSYIIPAGTIHSLQDAHTKEKEANLTETVKYEDYQHVLIENGDYVMAFTQGNNGRLTIMPEDTKSVDITKADSTVITDADGKVVMVGDTLTYTIKVVNHEDSTAMAVVTDMVPVGTELIEDSLSDEAGENAVLGEDGKTITWTIADMSAGQETTVSFQVKVTEAALSAAIVTIENTASIQVGNDPAYNTNTTTNPPEGKKATDTNGEAIVGKVSVGDVLVYRIFYYNDNDVTADVTITDIIPEGTTYVENSASHGGTLGTDGSGKPMLAWTIEDVAAGVSGVVSFRVVVNASAVSPLENGATIQIGENDPQRETNKTSTELAFGDLKLTKQITVSDGYTINTDAEFTFTLTESTLTANGTYVMVRNGNETNLESVTFTNGMATVTIKHNDTLVIRGLQAGIQIVVTETAVDGYTPSYSASDRVTIVEGTTPVEVGVTNAYDAAAAVVTLSATKNLVTNAVLADTTFGFTAYPCDENGVITDRVNYLTGETTVSSTGKTAEIIFSPLTFAQPGTYYYLVDELNSGLTGMTYDETQYLVKIVISDNGSGKLQSEVTISARENESGSFVAVNGSAMTFTNTYQPKETELILTGTKELTGRTLKAGEFGFEVVDASGTVVSSGINNADGTITFRPITYDKTGTYSYTIREIKGGQAGVTYDDATFAVTVTVEDVNGQLVATPSYASAVKFTNAFAPQDVSVVLTGTKKLTGRDLIAGEFSFIVTEDGVEVATATNDAQGNIVFSAIVYDKDDVGTHTYVISEIVPDVAVDPNMKYDGTTFTVTVEVSYDENTGVLSAVPAYPDGGVVFNNIQNPSSVEVTPQASKTTTNAPEGTTFSFVVINVTDNSQAGTGVGVANGDVTFSVLNFTQPGIYEYWIREANAGKEIHGITYDADQYLMRVVVSRNNDNKLEAAVSYYSLREGGVAGNKDDYTVSADKPGFQNSYAASGHLNITATKTLNGRTLKDGEFAFRLVRVGTGEAIEGVAAANGTITFATMYYTLKDMSEEGVKVLDDGSVVVAYTMSEVVPSVAKLPGVTYDNATYDVYVKLTHNDNGTITAVLSDENGNAKDTNKTGITFTNTYRVVEGTSAPITATKELTGRDLIAGEFSFHLYHVVNDNGTEKEILVETATNDKDGKVVFTRHYPATVAPGTYTYRIREYNNKLSGVTYSTASYDVQVAITDVGGKLAAAVEYIGGTPAFENTYEAADTSLAPMVNKELTGRALRDNEFAFEVTEDKENGQVVSTGLSKADGSIQFSQIGFGETGTYKYVITEVKGNLTGVTYDDGAVYMIVTVTDDQNGKLVATATYYSDSNYSQEITDAAAVVFRNKFTPADAIISLQAVKELNGRDMTAGEFSFVVLDETGAVVATGGNDQDGNVRFSDINVSRESLGDSGTKTFVYTMKELNTGAGGVTYSDALYEVSVTVTHNMQTGNLDVEYAYPENQTPQFINTYAPAPAKAELKAYKTLINKSLLENEFSFVLLDASGNKVAEGYNQADGSILFDHDLAAEGMQNAWKFNSPGEYVYTLKEMIPDPQDLRYVYDTAEYKVVVTVTDDNKGRLHAVTRYYAAEDYETNAVQGTATDLGTVEFINSYTPDKLTLDLSLPIGATKEIVPTIEGSQRVLADKEFQFVVKDIHGNSVFVDDQGQPIYGYNTDLNGDGLFDEIWFPEFTFDTAGEYHYWISEVETTAEGITIDTTVWEMHVLVRYDAVVDGSMVDGVVTDGMLYISEEDCYAFPVGQTGRTHVEPVFRNSYDPADATLTLTLDKELTGRDLKENEFVFLLVEVVQEREVVRAYDRNDADGNVTLSLTYDQPGTYSYRLVEHEPDNAEQGITYDPAVYAVEVIVEDDGQGHLVVSSVMVDGRQVANGSAADNHVDTGITFQNSYCGVPVNVVLNAYKMLSGRSLKDGEFAFELVEYVTNEVKATAVNCADGNVIFETLTLDQVGTYTYIMREVAGNSSGITYDKTEYVVIITVTDDMKGSMHAEVQYGGQDAAVPEFKNTYKPPVVPNEPTPQPTPPASNPNTGDAANVGLWICLMGISLVTAAAAVMVDKRKRHV